MVRKNLVGAPLLREKIIKDVIFVFGIIPLSVLIGTTLNTFRTADLLLFVSLGLLIISWVIFGNLYNNRAYNLREEWE